MIMGLFILTHRSESKVEVSSENPTEFVVTIEDSGRSMLAEGDSLRKAFKFNEAIPYYQNVVDMDGIYSNLKAEAQYYIGLCTIWKGEFDKAENIYQQMLQTYDDDGEAVANSQYCLAWLEVQNEEYYSAIDRLQNMLNVKTCYDEELYARTQFKIGNVYLSFLNNRAKANEAFRKVMSDYPDSYEARHPYLDPLR